MADDLRRTAASLATCAGADVKAVQRTLESRAHFTVITDAGHRVNAEQPEQFRSGVEAFLTER
jgi:pimeloyl-ACP methyl ester carboxylesterase